MFGPRQAFEDRIRPAELLVRVYWLLESDGIQTEGAFVVCFAGASMRESTRTWCATVPSERRALGELVSAEIERSRGGHSPAAEGMAR